MTIKQSVKRLLLMMGLVILQMCVEIWDTAADIFHG